ncbi:hypothetical protein HMPREF1984_01163 [Leptotrichia sp. oral taxon 215 str. W9775]|uniref:hypothetical protein n=1 Tax=Leptotrichia sp. oral taxon 215 TaxID=712359 RepID=UPI0003ADE804|nr:hypothetical protein [Leptotrichia sp. oral taxon 215]ERK67499.1 hypothetical protein HMPREF1984_01163 [Leptotrichia sp. oral taxon 215 str. W9775]
MKKLLLIVLMVLSLQLFSEDYKVVLKKGVTLSQQEINKNNKEIEVAFKRDYRLITAATFEGVKAMASGMMESQLNLPAMDSKTSRKVMKKTEEYTIGLFNELLNKYKTKIIKIRYAANDIVEVTAEISIPDITKSFDNYMQLMSEDDIFNEKKLAEMSKLPKEEFEDIIIEKMFDNMTKSFKNIEGYTSMKGTIYLEKDNGRWGVAELEEKVRNFREMYKKSK